MAPSSTPPPRVPPPPPDDAAGLSARLDRALASAMDGFFEYDLRTEAAWYSDSLRRMLGLTPEQLPDGAGRLAEHLHPDDVPVFEAAADQSTRDGAPFEIEVRLRDSSDCWRWVRSRGRMWPGPDGRRTLLAGSLTDVHAARESRQALQRMSERYGRAMLATSHALFERMLDEDRMVVADRVWEALGYEPGEMPSTRSALLQLLHPDDRVRYEDTARQARDQLADLDVQYRMRCKSGDYRWFHQMATPHVQADGRVRVTGVLIDVDEQVRARQALERDRAELERLVAQRTASLEAALAEAQQARDAAERATAAKSLFVAHMSHEIRTPLNGVLGLTELALQIASSPTQRRHLEVALQSGRSLLQVVDEVLDFSRAQGGHPPADEAIDLPELLAVTTRSLMPLARGRQVAVHFDWLGRRTRVRGDPARLRHILVNLLGNALKFTEEGHVGVITEVVELGDGTCRMRMQVEDTGPGIAPEQQAQVFDAFVQGDASLSRRHGGTGLGLATARALAVGLGGDITLRSQPGAGSVFTLTLTLRTEGPLDPEPPPPDGPVWMVATDPGRVTWMLQQLLRRAREVQQPTSLAEAAERALQLPADERPVAVLISQWALSSPADLQALRQALPEAHLSMLLRPDWHRADIEQAAQALHITSAQRPLTPRALDALLRPAPRPAPVVAEAAAPFGTPPEPAPALSAPGSHVLLVEDNPVNRMIGEGFLQALGVVSQTADDGAQALDACARQAPALVLMDLQMPVMDGLEATRRLRALQQAGQLRHFPIVALTAHALESDRQRAMAAGMDGYLTKPLLLDALRQELGRWLPQTPGCPAATP